MEGSMIRRISIISRALLSTRSEVADRVATSGDECFLCDITDALEFWGIPYEREDRTRPFAV